MTSLLDERKVKYVPQAHTFPTIMENCIFLENGRSNGRVLLVNGDRVYTELMAECFCILEFILVIFLHVSLGLTWMKISNS